ncbi:hypothetical protein BASA84_001458 [Batrachochytrium salamandrivorans]|nr:hypothetical protein BASA84_001458 [Batrachochytrium salamandrivorans]
MKPFIPTLVALLATSTAPLALSTVTYADQSFLERRANDDDPPTPPPRVESLLPADDRNRDPPPQSKSVFMFPNHHGGGPPAPPPNKLKIGPPIPPNKPKILLPTPHQSKNEPPIPPPQPKAVLMPPTHYGGGPPIPPPNKPKILLPTPPQSKIGPPAPPPNKPKIGPPTPNKPKAVLMPPTYYGGGPQSSSNKPKIAPKPYNLEGKGQPRPGDYGSGSNAEESTQEGLDPSARNPRKGKKSPEPENMVDYNEDLDNGYASIVTRRGGGYICRNRPPSKAPVIRPNPNPSRDPSQPHRAQFKRKYALGSGGWVSLLASEFAGKHDVLDRGYPGYHTRQWLELLAPVFRDSLRPGVSPALITLLLGTNDAYTMSVDEYSLNLAKIVSEIKDEYPHAPFVMFTPPPTVHTTFLKASTVVLYRNAWLKVAQDFRINYIDLWKEVFPSVQGEFVFNRDYNSTIASPYFVQDGVHLSDAGNGMVYSSLKRLLQTVYPDIYS